MENEELKQTAESGGSHLNDGLGDNFGQRLSVAMRVCGVRQVDLANATGIAASQICSMIRGDREPSLPNLAKLLSALPGCDARWLICGEF